MSIADKVSRYKEHESAHIRNRAKIVSMTLKGESSETIAGKVGLSLGTVKKWQSAWEKDGIHIFPEIEDEAVESYETEITISDSPQEKIIEIPQNETAITFPEIPEIQLTGSMAEAGRIIMLEQLQAILEHEPIAREGKNIEGVHQMRVATRRWRSAYDTFGDYLPKAYQKGIPKALKRTAKRLGKVRDLDVFSLKTEDYIVASLGEEDTSLEALLNILTKDRQKAHRQLLEWLEDKQYQRLIKRAFKLLTQTIESETLIMKSGRLTSTRLDHVLPIMIYQRFEAVRRYEELLPDASIETLHSLRKDSKRLRYILEMFSDILGDDVKLVINAIKMIQDHLGNMVDAEVAMGIIRTAEKQVKKAERPALKSYRKYRQAEIAHLRDSFTEVWSVFNQAEIRYALAQSVAVL